MFSYKKQMLQQSRRLLQSNLNYLKRPFNLKLRKNSNLTNILQGGPSITLNRSQKTVQTLIGAGATFGLLTLVAKGWTTQTATHERSPSYGYATTAQVHNFTNLERNRLFSTYGHVLFGLATTTAFASLMFRSGFAFRMMSKARNPILLFGATFAATIGTMMATQMIDYNRNPGLKHLTWSGFNASIAFSLCPLGLMGGQLLYRAALATLAIVGSLSSVAAVAPSDQFLNQGGGLSIGLGVLIAASVGQLFFPSSSLLYNIVLYGGLGLFSLQTLHDTQLLLKRIRSPTPYYDPINSSLGLYMDIINIFTRVVMIMSSAKMGRNQR